jgi:serine/threonine protein kinase/tetratricopeptide (TPR) repeat protein
VQPGDRIAQYTIIERIGAGGMGEVYKACDTRLGRYAALKLLPQSVTADEERVRRFVREAKSASALTHPNIVTIYDADRADSAGTPTWYIAMELVDGETLRMRMRRGGVDFAAAASLVAQTADALAKAHSHGIVHRDLKPENIMVTADGFAKVLDFGLAKLIDESSIDADLTADGVIVGTISYMSPEQIRGGAVDARSDLFAIGCVLYELVSLRRPYAAPSARESLHRTLFDDPERIDAPSELLCIIDRCLRKRPEERYASAKDLASDLRRFLRRLEREAEPPPLSIAVLPFRDLTASPDNAHIGHGLADAITTELASSKKLIVRPTSAVAMFRDSDPIAAGRALGVDAVVDGAFQRAGARLRVTVQLVSTDGARSMWATKLDSSLDDLFAVQDEVALRIAESLSIDLRQAPRTAQPAASANEWLMKGKLALSMDTIEKIKEALDAFTTAISIDARFAPAWAGLADVYSRLAFDWDPGGEWHRKATEASERALAIEPNLAEAHYVLGRLVWSPQSRFDYLTAMRHFAAALQLNPNLGEAHSRLGVLLFHVNALAESEEELRLAVRINPADAVSELHLATCALIAGDYEKCLELLHERMERAGHAWPYYMKSHALIRLNRDAEAVALTDLSALLFPETAFYLPLRVVLAARAGDRARTLEQIQRTIEHENAYGHYHHAQYDIACGYALLGERDLALQWLRAAAGNGYPCAMQLERDPLLANARGPELDALITELRALGDEHRRLYLELVPRGSEDDAITLRMPNGS